MENMINNLINGNLKDAKKQAKNRKLIDILNYCNEMGMDEQVSLYTALYLKGDCDFETYCNKTR